MLLVIIGLLLKLLGILVAIPNTIKHFKSWRAKHEAKLCEDNFVFLRRGNKPKIGLIYRQLYRLVGMPFPYLYMKERKIDQSAPSFLDEETRRRRLWKAVCKKIKR